MATDYMALNRRNIYERKIVRILRGEYVKYFHHYENNKEDNNLSVNDILFDSFLKIREFSNINSMDVRPVGSQYISTGELSILRWIAEAQRQAGLRTYDINDHQFQSEIEHCADILKGIGAILPSQTLFAYQKTKLKRMYD